MTKISSHEIRLASRPTGMPAADNFVLAQTELELLQDQQVLVRNLYMSVDPCMRGRMNYGKSYLPPFQLGKPLDGGTVGEFIDSRPGNSSRAILSLPSLAGGNTSRLSKTPSLRRMVRIEISIIPQ